MELNIINGIHKRIAFLQIFISIFLLPFSIMYCINEKSIKSIIILLSIFSVIVLFTVLLEVAFHFEEPHKMRIDYQKNEIILVYRKKEKKILNVITVQKVNEKFWFIEMFFDYGFYHNIIIKYEDERKIKEKYIGYATKRELKKLV